MKTTARRGASIGTVILAMAGLGLVGVAGWAAMTGTTPCELLGACDTGVAATSGQSGAAPAVTAASSSIVADLAPQTEADEVEYPLILVISSKYAVVIDEEVRFVPIARGGAARPAPAPTLAPIASGD